MPALKPPLPPVASVRHAIPPPPPPKGTFEQREHQRFELFASVKITLMEETLILAARNVSIGGVLLSVSAKGVRDAFLVGSLHDVLLFDALDEHGPMVRVMGRVVRHEPDAVALQWASESPDVAKKLSRLLAALQPKPRSP